MSSQKDQAAEGKSKEGDSSRNVTISMRLKLTYKIFVSKDDAGIVDNDPVAIRLDELGFCTLGDSLMFNDKKDIFEEMRFCYDSSEYKPIEEVLWNGIIMFWTYYMWRFMTKKEGLRDTPK